MSGSSTHKNLRIRRWYSRCLRSSKLACRRCCDSPLPSPLARSTLRQPCIEGYASEPHWGEHALVRFPDDLNGGIPTVGLGLEHLLRGTRYAEFPGAIPIHGVIRRRVDRKQHDYTIVSFPFASRWRTGRLRSTSAVHAAGLLVSSAGCWVHRPRLSSVMIPSAWTLRCGPH